MSYLVYHGSIASHEREHRSCSFSKTEIGQTIIQWTCNAQRQGIEWSEAMERLKTFGMAKGTFHVSGIIDDGNQS